MKVHYINILLFALPLNILEHNKNEPHTTPNHTQTTRSLCECKLYSPANYDNDPQMKSVIDNFNKQTQQRLHEYDERMKTTRQKCKDKCDKEIQKIILKDKLEKQMVEQFSTLQTDIQSDAIPTCICEKSLADKTEKFCHNCGYGLGSVAPSIGLLGGPGIYGWKTAALAAATKDAITKGLAAGEAARIKAGIEAVISGIKSTLGIEKLGVRTLESIIDANTYTKSSLISGFIETEYLRLECESRLLSGDPMEPICTLVHQKFLFHTNANSTQEVIDETVKEIIANSESISGMAAKKAIKETTTALTTQNAGAVNATYASCQTVIIASVVAILIIVLVLVIIYLILRYRRKKKMKKKLQYIKLLKE
ncbi:hypothetical protein PFBG_00160 [Plasmodium falciparum 7G8]|uniref:Rifin n=1 Tax=Plasmodium falciparum (isolate 7G8) TaxID=57266 RepID=W7FUZ1_PLAF8|nr:hypothetical protein PFBG_00160 [Plasmodium falciparum 7G8]